MKRLIFCLVALACLVLVPVEGRTDSINVSDSYGVNRFAIDLFTDLSPTGILADLFITETYNNSQYQWAIPLTTHDGFLAGNVYAVGRVGIAEGYIPSPGSGTPAPLQIATLGENYGISFFGGGMVQYLGPSASSPFWDFRIIPNLYEEDLGGSLSFNWGTAATISVGPSTSVPEPATMLLLGSGLLGLATFARKRRT